MKGRNQDDATPEAQSRYDDELLSANWNPVIDLLASSCARTAEEARRAKAEALSEEDAAAFLANIYTLG